MNEVDVRAAGYRAVDMIVDRSLLLPGLPVGAVCTPAELDSMIPGELPEKPGSIDAALDIVQRLVSTSVMHHDHPRFLSFVPGPGDLVGALADLLASGCNVFGGSWMGGSAAVHMEQTCVGWLRQLLGMPAGTGGVFTPGGSHSTLAAFAAARDRYPVADRHRLTAYWSDQAHGCMAKALSVLGFRPDQVRVVPSDAEHRIDMRRLTTMVRADIRRDQLPFLVAGTAGTTSTGSVDPLPELAKLARRHDMWFHIDGAYGAPAAMTSRGRRLLAGMDECDSLVVNPHKWLFQPYECSVVLMRDAELLKQSFSQETRPYLAATTRQANREINPYDYGVDLTRRFRALKLWMSLTVHGAQSFRSAIDHGLDMAEYAAEIVAEYPEFELITPPSLAVVTFGHRSKLSDLHDFASSQLADEGTAVVAPLTIDGRPAFRLCTINPRTTREDIRLTISRLAAHVRAYHTTESRISA
jgi:aromatic-L-amino-acid/L-tryptophan decarboxylase